MGVGGLSAFAQLNSSVNVEGEYEPLIIETERLNTFPQGYKFELPAANIDYEYSGVVTDYKPGLLTMGVTGRQTERPWKLRKGFVDFRMGSYLNSRLHAGYNIIADSVNTFDADLKFRSSTLYRIHGVPSDFTRPERKRLYDGKLGLYYSRVFGQEGLLTAGLSYRLAYFNYYGTTIKKELIPSETRPDIPTQTLNSLHGAVNYSSSVSPIRGWHAGASVDFTAYRRLYGQFDRALNPSFPSQKGDRETYLKIDGGYAFTIADNSAIAVDADGDFLFYPERDVRVIGAGDQKGGNYGIVTLTPSYRFAKEGILIQAGIDMALSYDVAAYAPDVAKFQIAPDVDIQYHSPGGFGLMLKATGGVTPSTLILREMFDRYQLPYLLCNKPIYTPLDALLGINAGPFAGFEGSIGVRYAIAKNIPIGGWYQEYLGAYPPVNDQYFNNFFTPNLQTVNLHGLGLNLNLKYSYGTLLELCFDGNYTPQNGEKGIFNGFDRPRWVLDAKATARPVKKLKIELEYEYRGVRNCYAYGENYLPGIIPALKARRLPDITDLKAKFTYSLSDNFDLYVSGNNLLGRRVELLPGLQSEGVVICGGFYWEF